MTGTTAVAVEPVAQSRQKTAVVCPLAEFCTGICAKDPNGCTPEKVGKLSEEDLAATRAMMEHVVGPPDQRQLVVDRRQPVG